jgi:hypothetical protein
MSNRSRENKELPTQIKFRNCVKEFPQSTREHYSGPSKRTPQKESGQSSERNSTSRKGRIIKKVIIYRREKLPKRRLESKPEC